jgi:hypothetical protein
MKNRISPLVDQASLAAPPGIETSPPVAAKPAGPAAGGAGLPEAECWRLLAEGRNLTAAQARVSELKLQRDPLDLPSRLRLLGRRDGDTLSPAAFDLLLGLIEHHPGSRIAGHISTMLPAFDFRCAQVIEQWQRQIAAHPTDVRVLGNAAIWLLHDSWLQPQYSGACKALLMRLRELEPRNPEWAAHLGLVCFFEAGGGLGGNPGPTRKLPRKLRAAAVKKAADLLAVATRLREEQGLDGNGALSEYYYIRIAELACWRASQRHRAPAKMAAVRAHALP